MKPLIRRAAERGHFKNEWLDTRYAFSFSDYYDEAWMGFRTLRVINEDIVTVGFAVMPALSRACSIVKESPQYAAWLKREGKA